MSDWRRKEGEDFRYSVTVFLMRENRPNYWEFHCPYCTAKLCDLDGTMVQMRDVSHNALDTKNAAVRIRCPGTSKHWCRMWFEFALV